MLFSVDVRMRESHERGFLAFATAAAPHALRAVSPVVQRVKGDAAAGQRDDPELAVTASNLLACLCGTE